MSDVLLGILGGFVGGVIFWTTKAILSRYIHWRREKTFLRFVRVTLPNARTIEVVSVSDSDKQVIENIERRLRDASRTL